MIHSDRSIRVALEASASYFMKSPPRQFTDPEARQLVEAFSCGEKPVAASRAVAPAIAAV